MSRYSFDREAPEFRHSTHFLDLASKAREAGDPMLTVLARAIEHSQHIHRWMSQFLDGYGLSVLEGRLGESRDDWPGWYDDESGRVGGPPSASHLVEQLWRSTRDLDRECDELLKQLESRLEAAPKSP